MDNYTRATTAQAVQKVNHLRTNPPTYEENQRVNLRWVDELGFEWASNFTCFDLALDFMSKVEIVAINAEWY